MKKLNNIIEGIFDADSSFDKVEDKLSWQNKIENDIDAKNGPQLRKDLIGYLEAHDYKPVGKKFKKKGIELGIYDDDGCTLVDWDHNECWSIYEFKDPIEYNSYGVIAEYNQLNLMKYSNVYKVDKDFIQFFVDTFFDF